MPTIAFMWNETEGFEGDKSAKGANQCPNQRGHPLELYYRSGNHFSKSLGSEGLQDEVIQKQTKRYNNPNTSKRRLHLETLHNIWQTLEIAGVSLLDMQIWRWMYANPDATPEMLKEINEVHYRYPNPTP